MIIKLAVKDLIFDRLISICIIASITAVIAPLLLLFSLKYGIVSTMENNLKKDPKTLEIRMMSGYQLDATFFNTMKNDPDVGFIVPNTRSLSATGSVLFNHKVKLSVEIIPTADGDPLIKYMKMDHKIKSQEVYVTSRLAEELGIKNGDIVTIQITRKIKGHHESKKIRFNVICVLSPEISNIYAVYMSLSDLIAIEDYRDGFEPMLLSDGSKLNKDRKYFAKARIYAKSIDSVEPLSLKMRQNFNIIDHLADVAKLKSVDALLRYIFLVIACTSMTGGILALFGLVINNIKRKSKTFAALRLCGISKNMVILMILFENILLSLIAYLFSLTLYFIGKNVLTNHFNYINSLINNICILETNHIALGFAICLVFAVLTSFLSAKFALFKKDFAATLREV